MGHEFLPLKDAAAHVHIDERELLHCVQRGEVPAERRGDGLLFDLRLLDEWAQRRLLALGGRDLRQTHAETTREQRERGGADLIVTPMLAAGAVGFICPRAKGGVIRDMADLAEGTGFVYDPESYYRELVDREEVASTAIGGGGAFLHARFHDPYHASESFIAFARSASPVFFGSQDGEPTDLFFLVCCTDHNHHLRTLARLAMMAHGTDLFAQLREASDAETVLAVVERCEREIIDAV